MTLDDVYLGNGASELIAMAINALLDDGRRGAAAVAGLSAVDRRRRAVGRHARALRVRRGERLDARPRRHRAQDHAEHRASWSSTRTTRPARSIRTTCSRGSSRIARQHGLVVFADEVYDKSLYDGATHTAIASSADDVLPHLQRPVEELPLLRLSRRLDGGLGREEARERLHRGPQHALDHAAVRQRARPVGDPDRARRLPEHQRPRRRPAAARAPARPRLRTDHRDPGRHLRQAEGGAVHVPEARPEALPDRGRPAVLPRAARGGEGA